MLIHRFCSKGEYEAFMRGEVLKNYTDHGKDKGENVTNSVGFCFFVDDPEKAKHRLSGIVDFDYCMTFSVDRKDVRKTRGRYVKWGDGGEIMDEFVMMDEYCCTEYDNKRFKLVSATKKFRGYAPKFSELITALGFG